jgi:hypothetical protein
MSDLSVVLRLIEPRYPANSPATHLRTCVRDEPGGVYAQFQRALRGRHVIAAWGLAGELPQVPLADALELLLLARDLEPARFDRGVPRWHARLCGERRLSTGEAQLALAALGALPGAGAISAAHALSSLCEQHGLEQEVRVLERWIDAGQAEPS